MFAGITVAVEGPSDEIVARRLAEAAGLTVHHAFPSGGKQKLDERLSGYNNAAQHSPWLVLRDLDQDAECAPTLVQQLVPRPAPHFLLRVPVRSMEAWLLAHREAMASFLGVRVAQVPEKPETLPDAKRALVNLARASRRRAVIQNIVPPDRYSSRVGLGYTSRIVEFALHHWHPEIAAEHAPSLRRCLRALRELTA